MADEQSKPFQILSLDGGGIKGLFSAAVLAHIEEDCNTRIIDHFDLIAGTSTGGIVALGLGMGLPPGEIVRFYCDHGPQIFRNVVRSRSALRLVRHKYPSNPLERALRTCFGEKLLANSAKRLIIPSYNLGEDDVYLFKTPHHERLTRDYKVPVWKVAMATTAAPTYFPAFRGVDHLRLIDGGVWANNPVMVAISEAVSMLEVSLSALRVMSLGTSDEVVHRRKLLNRGGSLQWSLSAVDVVLRGQSLGAHKQALHLLGKDSEGADRVIRLDPKVPDGLFSLDCMREDELRAKAAHESRSFMPSFNRLFKAHIASPYVPLYGAESTTPR